MMEEPDFLNNPRLLSPCRSARGRISVDSNSHDFEFCMLQNPSFPPPNLLSADELFSDGVLLPLHLLHLNQPDPHSDHDPEPQHGPEPEPEPENPPAESSSNLSSVSSTFTSSKRWKDIFKKSERKISRGKDVNMDEHTEKRDGKQKMKRERKSGGGGGVGGGSHGMSTAELNINIWPFSRSRSAGNGATRPRMAAGSAATARKVSSAPCSRSNSAGESKSRKWPGSPARSGGVHLGRSSPVCKLRRAAASGGGGSCGGRSSEKGAKNDGDGGRRKNPSSASGGGAGSAARSRVLSLNVPMCIGYRHQLSCRSDENSAIAVAAAPVEGAGVGGSIVAGEGVRGSNMFNIRSLFTKKVY